MNKMHNINTIINYSRSELTKLMDTWCKTYEDNFTGGKMRGDRGEGLENYVKSVIYMFGETYGLNIRAIKGINDKKELSIQHNGQTVKKDHQVDIHIYKEDRFVAVIECKAYLDSCYYVRACDDFKLFRKFGYNVKNYIFTLENNIDENTKIFTDVITDNICDDIFYLLDGKRTSSKPIYDKKFQKPINEGKLAYFINSLHSLLIEE